MVVLGLRREKPYLAFAYMTVAVPGMIWGSVVLTEGELVEDAVVEEAVVDEVVRTPVVEEDMLVEELVVVVDAPTVVDVLGLAVVDDEPPLAQAPRKTRPATTIMLATIRSARLLNQHSFHGSGFQQAGFTAPAPFASGKGGFGNS